jgi:manganese transport system ATP-binding protein
VLKVQIAASGRGVVLAYDGTVGLAASEFTVPVGVLTAVIGPNGSGKSTLLHGLAGLLEPRRGTIEVFGDSPQHMHDRIAYVLQTIKVNEVIPITVRETVAMGRYATLGPFRPMTRDDRSACDRAMARLGIEEISHRHLTELSGGQRQRVFVAQGLAQEADLLLLDEPLTALDLVSRERITQAIAAELDRGATVVLTTHDVAEANVSDHVLLMAGKVHTEGPPATALAPDRLSDAYGIGIVHLEDGSIALDDDAHRPVGERHVHFERGR